MNFVQRSLLSIKERKSRSIILFLAVLLICNVMAGAISVKKALLNTEKSFIDLIPIEVSIDDNYSVFLDNADQGLTEDIVKDIGKSQYVKNWYYYYKYWLGSKKLENGKEIPIVGTDEDNEFHPFNSFDIIGAYKETVIQEDEGDIKLVQGKNFSSNDISNGNNVILISQEVATKNKLSIGDKINLGSQVDIYSANSTIVEDEYEVIGIFETNKNHERDTEGNLVEIESDYIDTIYMPNNAIKNIHSKVIDEIKRKNADDYDTFSLKVKYQISSINELEEFKSENLSKLPKGYEFNDNSEKYNSVATPMQNMKDLSNIIVYSSIIASVIIIGLISILFCKERKKEMGIYLALGEKKTNIALQILLETLIIAIVAITISVFTGNMLATKVSKQMLENQINEQNTQTTNQGYYNSEDIVDDEEVMDNYKVTLDINTIISIYLIAIFSISISTILPIYYTLKLNPRKILM